MALDVSVIVVSYNTRELLADCLDSIGGAAPGLAVETIVVDNASKDGSADLVAERYPTVRLIRNRGNVGFAAANNQAIAVSRGRHLLLLNSDAMLAGGAIRRLADFLDQNPRAGIAGGMLLNPDGSFQASYADFPSLYSETLLLTGLSRLVKPSTFPSYPLRQSQLPREVDWVFGALMAARKSAVDQVGPMSEEYFMYTEETDWCYRFRKAGWTVNYLPDVKAVHYSGQSASKVPERKRSQLYHSKWLFMAKSRGRIEAGAFRIAVAGASVLKMLMWATGGFVLSGERRLRARQNVRSYMVLFGQW